MQEQGQPAALLLLRRDQLVRKPRMLAREAFDLVFHSLVVLAFADEQRCGQRPRGRDGEEQSDEREELGVEDEPEHADDRAGDDHGDEQQSGSSR